MPSRSLYRRRLGRKWNEGARLLWLAMEHHKMQPFELAHWLVFSTPLLTRYLYGDRRPCDASRAACLLLLQIPLEAWDMGPLEDFVLPALRDGDEPAPASRAA